jgi:membrane-bound lytic murein transglycosylase D
MKVSEAGKLVNMSENDLRAVNQIPKGMQVKQGSTLLVSRQGALDADVTEHLADNAQIAFAPEIVLRRIMVKVQKGDTLASLASRHDVTPSSIAAWNKLKMPVALKPGQSIAILVPTTASSRGSKQTGKKAGTKQVTKQGTKQVTKQGTQQGTQQGKKAPAPSPNAAKSKEKTSPKN